MVGPPGREPLTSPPRSAPGVDAAIGGIAGLAGGLLGVGGGFVMAPLQATWAHREQHRISGTSLAAVIPISLVGAAVYYVGRGVPQIDLPVAFFLVVGAAGGAYAGARAASRISERALKMLMATLLAVVGVKELYDAALGNMATLHASAGSLDLAHYLLVAVAGLVIGLASGLTGVGGGILMVPAMVLGFGIGQRVAQGTSLLAVLPISAIGAVTHHRLGNVDVRAAGWIAAAGVPSAIVGALLAQWLPERLLAVLFGLFLMIAALVVWPRRKEPPVSRPGGVRWPI
ncbi:MAG TPA: sulfite exporter TauE/SafE family protein [Candidatus Dormibacteraeota bacterium]|nr:sulfite exporter TauE/SafE family protein [Candidatus Dormibacteraeota bacterium]